MTDPEKPCFVALIHDLGYLQPNLRLGEIETAMHFASADSALKAGMSYVKRKRKDRTVEAIRQASP